MTSLKTRYIEQKQSARRRQILFLLTFDEWLSVWRQSGHLDSRGRGAGTYCMARIGDVGAYCVGNVKIITNHQNNLEGNLGRVCPEHSERMTGSGNPHFGKKHSERTKEIIARKMSNYWRGKPKTLEQRAKMSLARKSWWERRRESDAAPVSECQAPR